MMDENKVKQMLTPPDLMASKRVLCVQPHPDDNEVGAGATIAKLSEQGSEVYYLTITSGDLGGSNIEPEEIKAVRAKETEAAGRYLGVKGFYSLGLPDNMPQSIEEIVPGIIEVIRDMKADAILCPDPWLPYEAHADHRKTGYAVAQAFLMSGNANYPRGKQNSPWEVPIIAFYFTANPNTIIDTTATMEKKFAAMAMHESQFDENILELYRYYFTMKGRELAQGKGFEVGEGFKVMSRLFMHCFVDAIHI
ncbi:PIG-L deacetylase family protein [Mahella australiensis]|nr:PIG-L deacetylase family protein [Mahella australiensis]